MSRSQFETVRCIGDSHRKGCDRWLVKYDTITGNIVEKNRRVVVHHELAPIRIEHDNGAVTLDMPAGEWYRMVGDNDPKIAALIAKGVMIDPDDIPTERAPVMFRWVACCGARQRFMP